MKFFDKSFKQQNPISELAIQAAVEVMQSGRLHRYNRLDDELTETDLLELDFANFTGVKNVLACASCGYALSIALLAIGVKKGDDVLCNAYTLSPVPGAIDHSGGNAILVDMDESFCIDLEDLDKKAKQTKAKYLLLSHMRGHIVDMAQLMTIAEDNNLLVIEDCAHTMGAEWDGQPSGTFADVACFSTQTYKHINSGEGGLLITPHDQIMAKAIIYSGSYKYYNEHKAGPDLSAFDGLYETIPNYSGRMDNLRAAILRPQLANLNEQRHAWNLKYFIIEEALRANSLVTIPKRSSKELFVGSSIQFSLPSFDESKMRDIVQACEQRGVMLTWYGNAQPKGYASQFLHWKYLTKPQVLPKTQSILSTLLDMRIPPTFTTDDVQLISEIILEVINGVSDVQ